MSTADLADPIERLIARLKAHEPFGEVELRDVILDESGSGSGDDVEGVRLLVYLASPTSDEGWPVDDVFRLREEIRRYLTSLIEEGSELPPITVALLPETAEEDVDTDESPEGDLGGAVEDDPGG